MLQFRRACMARFFSCVFIWGRGRAGIYPVSCAKSASYVPGRTRATQKRISSYT